MRELLARYVLEAVLGVLVAGVILVVLAATVDSVPFVYQGY